jgi:hypothetical protein
MTSLHNPACRSTGDYAANCPDEYADQFGGDPVVNPPRVYESVTCLACRGIASGCEPCPQCGGCGVVPVEIPRDLIDIDLSNDPHRPECSPWTEEDRSAFARQHDQEIIDIAAEEPAGRPF